MTNKANKMTYRWIIILSPWLKNILNFYEIEPWCLYDETPSKRKIYGNEYTVLLFTVIFNMTPTILQKLVQL